MSTRLESLTKQYKRESDRRKRDLVRFQIQGEVSRLLASTMDRYSDCLDQIVETVAVIMDAERVSLMVRNKSFLQIAASVGIPRETLEKGVLIRLGQGIAGKVAQTGEPIATGDLRRDKDLKKDAVGGNQYKSNAFICLPLKSEDEEIVGVINVANPIRGNTFQARDTNFLKKVADLMGMFLYKSMQFEAMRHKAGVKGRVSLTGVPAVDPSLVDKARDKQAAAKKRLAPRPKRKPFRSRPPSSKPPRKDEEPGKGKPPPPPPPAKKKS
jgi:signal transduction protein with GAF and PtsI domain